MKLDQLAGTTDVDPSAAVAFLRRWYREGDLVTVVGVRPKNRQPHLLAQVHPVEELVAGIESEGGFLNSLVNGADGSQWNLYVQVNPAKAELDAPTLRGGDANVATFRGVWVDLDVKPGSFETETDALNFLRGLKVWPSMIVLTGTGGVHAYWRLIEDIDPKQGRELVRGWQAYLSEEAEPWGAKIDRLVDIARMMRLPGTIRWPKADDPAGTVAAQVTLLYSGGPDYSPEHLLSVAEPAAERREARTLATRQADQQRRLNADELAQMKLDAGVGRWQLLRAIAQVEDVFNDMVSWDDILGPAGWNFIREDPHGRREWGRPGRHEKSATTDYPESPHVMSLLSSSEDTHLFDLKDAGIPLTKYRVALRFWFDDNETDMVDWTIERLGQ